MALHSYFHTRWFHVSYCYYSFQNSFSTPLPSPLPQMCPRYILDSLPFMVQLFPFGNLPTFASNAIGPWQATLALQASPCHSSGHLFNWLMNTSIRTSPQKPQGKCVPYWIHHLLSDFPAFLFLIMAPPAPLSPGPDLQNWLNAPTLHSTSNCWLRSIYSTFVMFIKPAGYPRARFVVDPGRTQERLCEWDQTVKRLCTAIFIVIRIYFTPKRHVTCSSMSWEATNSTCW